MSQENVDLITAVQPGPDADVAALVRDDAAWQALTTRIGPLVDADFECAAMPPILSDRRYRGLDGLRALWLDWLDPWETYRTEIDDVVDAGDDVVVLVHDYGRRAGMDAEMVLTGGTIWTVRSGKVTRAAFYVNRQQALEAVGLSE